MSAYFTEIDFLVGITNALPTAPNGQLPSEWAEQTRVLTPGSTPFPGPFSWKRTPFWREVVDHFSPLSPMQHIAVMKSTQIGCTCAVYENVIGYGIDCNPNNILLVSGDQKMIDTMKKTRVDPMIDASGLRDRIRAGSQKKGANRTGDSGGILEYRGGFTYFCGSNNESNFQSQSFRTVLQDEVDLYPSKVGSSGETVSLVDARADSFPDKKIGYMSRPTVDYGTTSSGNDEDDNDDGSGRGSKILELYLRGDQRKYMVPCPHCKDKQELTFYERAGGFEDGDYGLKFDSEACKGGDFSSVHYKCKCCGGRIEEYHKSEFLQPEAGAEWVPTAKAKEPYYVSYHISALYSLTVEWWDIISRFLKAKGDPLKMQLFYNSVLGLPFDDRQGGVEKMKVDEKVGYYHKNQIPEGVLFLTAAADVQRGKKGRIEVEIKGWGRDWRNWSIDYRVIKGNTEDINDPCWKELATILQEHWAYDGVGLQVERMFIDSSDGTMTDTVYNVCEKFGTEDVLMFPIKGQAVTVKTRDYYKTKELEGRRFPLVEIFSDNYKNRIAGWLSQEWRYGEEPPIGWPQFPDNYTEEYFRMLQTEKRVKVRVGKFTVIKWEAHGRNESFDTYVYNTACAEYVIYDYCINYFRLDAVDPERVWAYFEEKFNPVA